MLLTAIQVHHSVYEYVVNESEVEKEFAKRPDEQEDIRLFVKPPQVVRSPCALSQGLTG